GGGRRQGWAVLLAFLEAVLICWFTTVAHGSRRRSQAAPPGFRQFAEALAQIVWTANAQGQTEYMSHEWGRYTGLPTEPAHGLPFRAEAIHPEDRATIRERWHQAVAAGTPCECEF